MINRVFDSPKALLNSISSHDKACILDILETAASMSKLYYVDERPKSIDGTFTNANDSRNINAAINSAFTENALGKKRFPYPTCIERLKGRASPVIRVEMPHAVLHFGKAKDIDSLPGCASYRKIWAFNNVFKENFGQVKMVFSEETISLGHGKYSIIVAYGLDAQKALKFARMIVPNNTFTDCVGEDLFSYRGMQLKVIENRNKRVVLPKRIARKKEE